MHPMSQNETKDLDKPLHIVYLMQDVTIIQWVCIPGEDQRFKYQIRGVHTKM